MRRHATTVFSALFTPLVTVLTLLAFHTLFRYGSAPTDENWFQDTPSTVMAVRPLPGGVQPGDLLIGLDANRVRSAVPGGVGPRTPHAHGPRPREVVPPRGQRRVRGHSRSCSADGRLVPHDPRRGARLRRHRGGRYLRFLQELLAGEQEAAELSAEVAGWLTDTASALAQVRPWLGQGPVSAGQRWQALETLGMAASRYRQSVYADTPFAGKASLPMAQVREFLGNALAAIDHSIRVNRRDDGMYHAYNVLDLGSGEARVDRLYLMLEGQVAALSSGALDPAEAAALVESLFLSDLYRADQRSFMLLVSIGKTSTAALIFI